MVDIAFGFGEAPNRYPDLVQRLAVLSPLFGPVPPLRVPIVTEHLQNQWRARVLSLVNCGWGFGNSDTAVAFARNCLPAFVLLQPASSKIRPCNNSNICPFCYARKVRDTWRLLDSGFGAPVSSQDKVLDEQLLRSIMFTDDEPRATNQKTFKYHLIQRHHKWVLQLPIQLPGADIPMTNHESLLRVLNTASEQRRTVISKMAPVGALLQTTVEPGVLRDRHTVTVRHRQLFKVHADFVIPDIIKTVTNGYLHRYDQPTRSVVLRATAGASQYPVKLLRGNPAMTSEILHARKVMRWKSIVPYGSFRKQRNFD